MEEKTFCRRQVARGNRLYVHTQKFKNINQDVNILRSTIVHSIRWERCKKPVRRKVLRGFPSMGTCFVFLIPFLFDVVAAPKRFPYLNVKIVCRYGLRNILMPIMAIVPCVSGRGFPSGLRGQA